MKIPAQIALLPALLATLALQAQTAQAPAPLPTGQVIESVPCLADSSQSYAAYLPARYTPTGPWPIVYLFDPLARGGVPVKLYQQLAEKYGFILAASNHARNFAPEETSRAANAIWQDTHRRFSLDERRVYTGGFSGGARVAGLMATRCPQCRIAGVIAFGAGYPNTGQPDSTPLLYFLAAGDQDFNWPEVVDVRRRREDAGLPYRVRVFSGPHQWAPVHIMEDALQWLQLKAMQAAIVPPDEFLVNQLFSQFHQEAREARQTGDALAQLSAYRALVSDFAGLKEVSEDSRQLSQLKQSAALRQALKHEDELISLQYTLTREIDAQLQQFGGAGAEQRQELRAGILDGMRGLKSRAQHARDDEQRNSLLRAFNALFANGIEAGQAQLEHKHWDEAERYFQLIAEASPDEPWPALLLAETRTASRDYRQAIRYLQEAVRRGLKNPEVLEKDPALAPLQGDADFQKLLQQLKDKR